MKYLLLLPVLWICSCKAQQKGDSIYKQRVIDSAFLEAYRDGMRCGVAHIIFDKGVFSCDFKGTLYPSYIYDTSIKKWFIKIEKNGDSLFYYKTDVERLYIWNGGDSGGVYGYEWNWGGGTGSTALPDKYKGYDTLRIWEQVWEPKNSKK